MTNIGRKSKVFSVKFSCKRTEEQYLLRIILSVLINHITLQICKRMKIRRDSTVSHQILHAMMQPSMILPLQSCIFFERRNPKMLTKGEYCQLQKSKGDKGFIGLNNTQYLTVTQFNYILMHNVQFPALITVKLVILLLIETVFKCWLFAGFYLDFLLGVFLPFFPLFQKII